MAQKTVRTTDPDSLWPALCDRLFDSLPSFSAHEQSVRESRFAMLVGLLPHFAKTESPMRDSLSNLTVHVFCCYGLNRNLFRRNFEDEREILGILSALMIFTGGREEIIDRGLSLLALQLLRDDRFMEQHSPLKSPNYRCLQKDLTLRVKATPCRKMDRILSLKNLQGPE